MWLEIDLEVCNEEIRVSGRGSRGERAAPLKRSIPNGAAALRSFAAKVSAAARRGKPLDSGAMDEARALYGEIFDSGLLTLIARMKERKPESRVVVRLFTSDGALSDVPFEALCKPGTAEGFLGTDPTITFARGVSSSEPWAPREVRGAVRVLAIAPGDNEEALRALAQALAPAAEAGEIEWLDPISGPGISPRALYEKIRRVEVPHVVHFLGHGALDAGGHPVLRMADDDDGEEVWLAAEGFARELYACFSDELRLVVLEACSGAKSGAMGSAAHTLVSCGADAVVAHLWPVKSDAARLGSIEMYRSLTGKERAVGDIGASLADARRTLLTQSAEAFSPVLYLRGSDSVILDFERRRVSKPARKRRAGDVAPPLAALLTRPFSMILGDLHDDKQALKAEVTEFMKEHDDKPGAEAELFALMQRCALKFGKDISQSLLQQSVGAGLRSPAPALVQALARLIPPGVHVTLLWQPRLEAAIAERQPGRTIYAIQPSLASTGMKPRIVKRAAFASVWKPEVGSMTSFDLDNDVVVLRLYGGYSPEARPIFSQPVLTEDDHFNGLFGSDGHPAWMEELLYRLRTRPALLVGLSVFDWRHRLILRWLYDQAPMPKDSLAILTPDTDAAEAEILNSGGATAGARRVTALVNEPNELAALLDAFESEAAR